MASTETGPPLPIIVLARIATFLPLRGGNVQNVLVAAPAAERNEFRDEYLHDTSYLSQAVLPGKGRRRRITYRSILRRLHSASTRRKINMFLHTPTGAKLLRESAGSAMVRPYTRELDGGRFNPSHAFGNAAFAIAVDNPDLLKWAMEVGSLDPNGFYDDGLIVGEEGGIARHLLFRCILVGSTECFEWLLSNCDVDVNARADSGELYCVLGACIIYFFDSLLGNGAYFLRRLLDHPAADANRPLAMAGAELTPLRIWTGLFAEGDFPSDRLEDSLRILNCLIEGGANVHFEPNDGTTPHALVKQNARSGGPEHQARHLLALELMGGGGDAISYLLEHGNSADVALVRGAVTSALKLRLHPSCVDVKIFAGLVWANSFFPSGVQRRLNNFICGFLVFWLVTSVSVATITSFVPNRKYGCIDMK